MQRFIIFTIALFCLALTSEARSFRGGIMSFLGSGQDADDIAGNPAHSPHSKEGDLPHEAAASTSRDHTADIIQRDLSQGIRADFPFLKEALTSFSDDDGIVREGVTFCGAKLNVTKDADFGDASGTLGAVNDGYGNVYNPSEEIKACGRNLCDEGSFVAILANRIRALGYHVQHADLCVAKAANALDVDEFPRARTCRLDANSAVRESYECNEARYEVGLDFFQINKQCFGLDKSGCTDKWLEYLTNETIPVTATSSTHKACAWDAKERKCYGKNTSFAALSDTKLFVAACGIKPEEKIGASSINNEIRRQPLYSIKASGKVELDDSVFVTGAENGNCNTLRNYVLALNGNAMLNAFRDINIEQATDYWRSTLKEARQYVKSYAATLKNFRTISLQAFPEIEYESFDECPVGETDKSGYDTGSREQPGCVDSRYDTLAVLNTLDSDAQYALRKNCFCRNGQKGDDASGANSYASEGDDIYLDYDLNATADCAKFSDQLPSVYQYCKGGFSKEATAWKNVLESLLPQSSRIQTFGAGAKDKRLEIYNELTSRTAIDSTCGRLVNADNSTFKQSNKGANCLPFVKLHEVIYRLEFGTAKAGIGASTAGSTPTTSNTFQDLFCKEKHTLANTEFSFRQLAYKWNHPHTDGSSTYEPRKDSLIYSSFATQEKNDATIVEKQRFSTAEVVDFCALDWPAILAGPVDRRDAAGSRYTDPYDLFSREIEEAIFGAEVAIAAKKDAIIDNSLLWDAIEEELTSDSDQRISYAIAQEAADHFRRIVTTDANDADVANKVDIEGNHGITHKCTINQRVKDNRCVTCATGSENVAGNEPLGDDTNCTERTCPINNFREVSSAGVASCNTCPSTSKRAAGDGLQKSTNTTCTCPESKYADGNGACTACDTNTFRSAGDDVKGDAKSCDLCTAGEGAAGAYADGNGSCIQCPANSNPSVRYAAKEGTATACNCDAGLESDTAARTCSTCGSNLQTDYTQTVAVVGASAANSTCNKCVQNYYGTGNTTTNTYTCVACPPGFKNVANTDAGAGLTAATHGCTTITCAAGQGSQSNTCYDCPVGTATGTAQTALTGAITDGSPVTANSNTACVSGACATNNFVSGHKCVACVGGGVRVAGDPTAGPDTVCA